MSLTDTPNTARAEELRLLMERIAENPDRAAFDALRRELTDPLVVPTSQFLPEPDASTVREATLHEVWTMARLHRRDDVARWVGQIVARRIAERLRSLSAPDVDPITAGMLAANDDRGRLEMTPR